MNDKYNLTNIEFNPESLYDTLLGIIKMDNISKRHAELLNLLNYTEYLFRNNYYYPLDSVTDSWKDAKYNILNTLSYMDMYNNSEELYDFLKDYKPENDI